MFKIISGVFFTLFFSSILHPELFDKNSEVRAFRSWVKTQSDFPKTSYYEGLNVLDYIAKKGLSVPAMPQALLKSRDQKEYLASIAQSVLSGYGFDEGIIDTPLSAAELNAYKDNVAIIGQHLKKPASALTSTETFSTTPGPHIDEHVRIANELQASRPPLGSPVSPLYTQEGFVRSEAAIRETFWGGHLVAQCSDVKCYTSDKAALGGVAGSFSPLQRISTTGTTQQGVKYNLRHQAAVLNQFGLDSTQYTATEIHYNVYISDSVRTGAEQPKGVVVKIYGGIIKEAVKPNTEACLENFMAHQGYIVYALNLRGTEDIDPTLLEAQGKSEGVISTLRDATYFAQMMKKVDGNSGEPDAKKFPKFSKLIKGKNIPFVLTGASFGGYMSMFTATHNETFEAVDFDDADFDDADLSSPTIFSYDHRTTYDAYIPIMGVSDIRGDMNSGTEVSERRRIPGIVQLQEGMNAWMGRAFHGLNILGKDADNIKVSPIYRPNLLERPVLLMHGLADRNTSPFESINFIDALFKEGKGELVAAYFDRDLGHSYPKFHNEMKSFYETIFRFMDSVAWHKKKGKPFKFPPKIQSSTFAANEVAALLTKARHEDLAEDDGKFILEALNTYIIRKVTQNSAIGLEEQVWETAKSNNWLSYIKALFARKAYKVYLKIFPKQTPMARRIKDLKKGEVFSETGLQNYISINSPPPLTFLDLAYRDSSNNPTGQIVQYYLSDDSWMSPILDASKNVKGLVANSADYLKYYDELMKSEFLYIIQHKPYILYALDKLILKTNIYFDEQVLPPLGQMMAPPPAAPIAPSSLVKAVAVHQAIPSRPISLGATPVSTIKLRYDTLETQLKNLPVDETGKAGRYKIGERTIKPTMLVIKKIMEGDCNLSDIELQPFLICVAATLNGVLGKVVMKGLGIFELNENSNIQVKKTSDDMIYTSSSVGYASISKEDLLNVFKKYCDYLKTGQNPYPEAVSPRLLGNIQKVYPQPASSS